MTLDYAQDFKVDANYDISKSDNKDEGSKDSYDTLMTGHLDKYLLNYDKNLLIYGSGTLGYRKIMGADDADDAYLQAGTGVGYGRIYDALEDIQTNTLTSTFAYYVANRVSLDTTLSFKKIDDGIDNNSNDNWESKLFVGVRYRLK